MGRLQVFDGILVGPTGKRQRVLQVAETAHGSQNWFFQLLHTQRGVALQKEVDIMRNDIIVDGHKRRIVSLTSKRMIIHQRITLGPSTIGILALKEEVDGLLQGNINLRILPLQIDAQQELSTVHGRLVVEGGIAVIVLEFLQTPGLTTDSRIPFLSGLF